MTWPMLIVFALVWLITVGAVIVFVVRSARSFTNAMGEFVRQATVVNTAPSGAPTKPPAPPPVQAATSTLETPVPSLTVGEKQSQEEIPLEKPASSAGRTAEQTQQSAAEVEILKTGVEKPIQQPKGGQQ